MSKTKKYIPIKRDKESEKENPYYRLPSKKVKRVEDEEDLPNFLKIKSPKRK